MKNLINCLKMHMLHSLAHNYRKYDVSFFKLSTAWGNRFHFDFFFNRTGWFWDLRGRADHSLPLPPPDRDRSSQEPSKNMVRIVLFLCTYGGSVSRSKQSKRDVISTSASISGTWSFLCNLAWRKFAWARAQLQDLPEECMICSQSKNPPNKLCAMWMVRSRFSLFVQLFRSVWTFTPKSSKTDLVSI